MTYQICTQDVKCSDRPIFGDTDMSDRRRMRMSDWAISVVLLVVGALLGLAVVVWVGSEEPAFWLSVIFWFIPIGFINTFVFFLSDVSAPSLSDDADSLHHGDAQKHKPMLLLYSLPAGFVIGAIGIVYGFSEVLL